MRSVLAASALKYFRIKLHTRNIKMQNKMQVKKTEIHSALFAKRHSATKTTTLLLFTPGTPMRANVDSAKKHFKIATKTTFKTRRDLKLHVKTHPGVSPYNCKDCGNRFAQSANMKRHIESKKSCVK